MENLDPVIARIGDADVALIVDGDASAMNDTEKEKFIGIFQS